MLPLGDSGLLHTRPLPSLDPRPSSLARCAVAAAALLACSAGRDATTCPSASALRASGAVARAARPIPGRYIVVLQPGGPSVGLASEAYALAREHGAAVAGTWRALHGFVAAMSEAQAAALAAHPRVAWVEEDGVLQADGTQSGAPWGLDRIDQRQPPLDGQYDYATDGHGVHAYVIDSGIRATHAEFGGRVLGEFTALDDGRGTDDCYGHGTHVAGVLGGATYGVAKGVTLHAVRVLDCVGSGSVSDAIAGIDWVTAHHVSPAVANLSLGGGASAALDEAVRRSIDAGVTYVVSAGNGSGDACLQSPARVAAAIAVGASDSADAQAPFSNFGSCVALYAPGVGITSAWGTGDAALNTLSGTSTAAPHVAGTAALYLALNPSASPADVADALVANADADVLTGLGPGSPDRLLYQGFVRPGAVVTANLGRRPAPDACQTQ